MIFLLPCISSFSRVSFSSHVDTLGAEKKGGVPYIVSVWGLSGRWRVLGAALRRAIASRKAVPADVKDQPCLPLHPSFHGERRKVYPIPPTVSSGKCGFWKLRGAARPEGSPHPLRLARTLALPIRPRQARLLPLLVLCAVRQLFKNVSRRCHCYAQAGGRWMVRPLGNVTTSGSWHFAGRSRGMFL